MYRTKNLEHYLSRKSDAERLGAGAAVQRAQRVPLCRERRESTAVHEAKVE